MFSSSQFHFLWVTIPPTLYMILCVVVSAFWAQEWPCNLVLAKITPPSAYCDWCGDGHSTEIGQSQFSLDIFAGTLEKMHPLTLGSHTVKNTNRHLGLLAVVYQIMWQEKETRPTHIASRTRDGERKAREYHLSPQNLLYPTCTFLLCLCPLLDFTARWANILSFWVSLSCFFLPFVTKRIQSIYWY